MTRASIWNAGLFGFRVLFRVQGSLLRCFSTQSGQQVCFGRATSLHLYSKAPAATEMRSLLSAEWSPPALT